MTEQRRSPTYPPAFLADWEPMECLAVHERSETLLVRCRQKEEDRLAVARCYIRHDSTSPILPETDLLQGISGEGLPAFLDSYESEDMFCLVREYIPGRSLRDYAEEEDLSQDRIVEICRSLCRLLSVLHEQNPAIIHRDIKPENIIVSEDGKISLIDFDIARTVKEEAEEDTLIFGTKGYAAPEQYGFAQTDARTDIYSLGVLLRYLLTGSIRINRNVRIYQPLQKIIDRCTALDPDARYQTARALDAALADANPASILRRRFLRAAGALALCALLALGGLGIYRYVSFDPYGEGHIPSVLQDEERAADAVAYLADKYGTHMFDDTGDYVTMGQMRDALSEIYGLDYDYAHAISDADPPEESDRYFFPWGKGDEQNITQYELAYAVVKVYWPDVVTDWSSIRDDQGEYPGSLVAYNWCQKYGIFTGVVRPDDLTQGEAAIAFANADRIYEALQEQETR